MATSVETSDIHKSWLAASEKFDYFLLGISAAALAYLGEKFVPEPIALSQNTIELFAIISLGIAFLASLLRIENTITVLSQNLELLKLYDDQTELVKALHEPKQQIDVKTGDIFNPQIGEVKLEVLVEHEEHVNALLTASKKKAVFLYRLRKWTLIIGFLGIIGAKLFVATTTTT